MWGDSGLRDAHGTGPQLVPGNDLRRSVSRHCIPEAVCFFLRELAPSLRCVSRPHLQYGPCHLKPFFSQGKHPSSVYTRSLLP
jgi:hypothetical protein